MRVSRLVAVVLVLARRCERRVGGLVGLRGGLEGALGGGVDMVRLGLWVVWCGVGWFTLEMVRFSCRVAS